MLEFSSTKRGTSWPRSYSYQLLLRRSSECEVVAQVARSMIIRRRAPNLRGEYREIADRLHQRDQLEQILKQQLPVLPRFPT